MEIRIPDIGDFDKVPVIEILVAVGDEVAAEDPLVSLESDKATMEIPAPQAGRITAIHVKIGDAVSQGDLLAEIEPVADASEEKPDDAGKVQPESASAPAPEPATASPVEARDEKPSAPEATPAKQVQAEPEHITAKPLRTAADIPYASPSIRRFARELGVDLGAVTGSGRKGRISRDDVQEYVKGRMQSPASGGMALPSAPQVDFSKFGNVERIELSRIRKLSAAHLHRCWLQVPHVTQCDSADITDLEAFRKSENQRGEGPKLTVLPFIMKACALLLRRYPDFNSALTAESDALIRRDYVNIGFAADTENGLVVPVVRDVDRKSIGELAAECAALAAKAREGKLKPADMQGGCFSISSLGGIGGEYFTPIVNSPEVAILGVSRASMQPVWDGADFRPRLMVPLSLSYDHRVIDGAAAARFTTALSELLTDIRRLLI